MERGFPLIVFFEKKKGLGLKNFFWLGFTPVPYPELFWGQYTSLGSQTQTPLISGVSFHHCLLSQGHNSYLLSYSECKITNIFQGFAPERHWGGLTALPLDSPTTQWFFSSLCLLKNQHPQKNCWIRCCTPSKAEQPLWGVELQKKEVKKD